MPVLSCRHAALVVALTIAACVVSGREGAATFGGTLADEGGATTTTTGTIATDESGAMTSEGSTSSSSAAGESSSGSSSSSTTSGAPTDDCDALWTSDAWGNGNARELEEEETDPDDAALFFSHAGDGSRAVIDGEGTLTLDGDQSRVYLLVPNQNVRLELDVEVTDPNLDNVSLALRCNHDEEGSFGKYGVALSWADTEVSSKIEYYHNDHSDDQSAELPEPLELDTPYRLRADLRNAEDGSRSVALIVWLRRADEREWTKVLDIVWDEDNWGEPPVEQDNPEYDDYADGPYMPEARRLWLRVNGTDGVTEGTRFSNVNVCDLGA